MKELRHASAIESGVKPEIEACVATLRHCKIGVVKRVSLQLLHHLALQIEHALLQFFKGKRLVLGRCFLAKTGCRKEYQCGNKYTHNGTVLQAWTGRSDFRAANLTPDSLAAYIRSAINRSFKKGFIRQNRFPEMPQPAGYSFSLSSNTFVAAFGSAFPLLIFISSPMKKPISPFFPLRYSATFSGKRSSNSAAI